MSEARTVESVQRRSRRVPAREVDFLLDTLRPRPDERIVDVGCGDGRLLSELHRRGCRHLAGLEVDSDELARARHRLGPAMELIEGDFVARPFSADCVFAWFGVVGFGGRDLVTDLRALVGALPLGGRFAFETINRDFFVRHGSRKRWDFDGTDAVLESVSLDYATSVLSIERRYVGPGGARTWSYVQRVASPTELRSLLAVVGAREIAFAADEGGTPCSPDHERLLVWGER